MIPDWLQPRLGEPLPADLVAWAATQPSLARYVFTVAPGLVDEQLAGRR